MIHIKSGVHNDSGTDLHLIDALLNACYHYAKRGYSLTVTALEDGNHMTGSLHYIGRAADLRTRDMPPDIRKQLVKDITSSLGRDYDVILEKDHIHLEYQPKVTQ